MTPYQKKLLARIQANGPLVLNSRARRSIDAIRKHLQVIPIVRARADGRHQLVYECTVLRDGVAGAGW